MPTLMFGPYAPDAAPLQSDVTDTLLNVYPRADGYGPVADFTEQGDAITGSDDILGAFMARRSDGTYFYFVGTGTKLFARAASASAWTDASGSAYTVPLGDLWSFAQFGDNVIACNANVDPQVYSLNSGGAFANLGGSPPTARTVSVIKGFVVLAGLDTATDTIHWSELEDPEGWTVGVNSSDLQAFPGGGRVLRVIGGDGGLIFQETAIRSAVFSGGQEVFQFVDVETERGALTPYSICSAGNKIFWLAADGFFAYAGGQGRAIGSERVNRAFFDEVDVSRFDRIVAVTDPRYTRALWFYQTDVGSNHYDRALVYDWTLDRWSKIACDLLMPAQAGVTQPDIGLDSITTPLEDMERSFDDFGYGVIVPELSGVTANRKWALQQGDNTEATVETSDRMPNTAGRSFVRGVMPLTDGSGAYARVGSKARLQDSRTWTDESAILSTGIAYTRSSGQWHRIRLRVPAAASWTYLKGVEIDVVSEGRR